MDLKLIRDIKDCISPDNDQYKQVCAFRYCDQILDINEWIYENNVTWQYAYGNIIDTLKSQQDIEKSLQETEEKPSDKIKRRELFAKKAEERKNKN